MEGIIQYRLLGSHPAASGRYLTVGFPGETTTTDKILSQVIQEHRINTSRYKLEVCRLVPARDAPTSVLAAAPAPPEGGNGAFSVSGVTAGVHNALVPVTIYGPDALHTYDRLTITVSKRDFADDEAARKEKERLEHQRRLQEMEEQLLSATSRAGHFIGAGSGGNTAVVLPPTQPSNSASGARRPFSSAAPAVDNLRLQRAAALAGQLFPIMRGQCGTLTGLHDVANTHQCVLCRFSAFEEMLTTCCCFCVCRSCYASASEMVMKEDQCPVCGTIASPSSATEAVAGAAFRAGGVAKGDDDSTAHGKRERDAKPEDRCSWKREEGEQKVSLPQGMSVHGAKASEGPGRQGIGRITANVSAQPGDAAAGVSSPKSDSESRPMTTVKGAGSHAANSGEAGNAAIPTTFSEDILWTESRLRSDLDQALSMLDAPDPLSAAAKAKRVISAELAALWR
ncbi:hypothetical protein JKF63_02254 [Porcisia hertigi]|uniref:Uncharacterized protein n=1 Tax=Porcisia hertigi TaxID=2761500 RepID=A0A836L1W5_9TRYP|nr:hypothetical protein JKF63_02254 [Porcisia hertigi]